VRTVNTEQTDPFLSSAIQTYLPCFVCCFLMFLQPLWLSSERRNGQNM